VHLPLLAAASQKSVLLIGGGLGGGIAEVLRYPVERLDYLELDPRALDIVRPRLPAPLESSLRDPRLRILHEDGRSWLGRNQRLYDVILVNLPPPATALVNRFYTREFFLLARENLEKDGLLVGFQFPLFTLMHKDAGTRAGPLGGRYYFLDLAGSALGVLLASLWLLPLAGMWGTLALCAAFKLASLTVLAARKT
jgi:spermidine synthase